ncbi:hypothetical protein GCM10025864_19870 [Luteimicrobium album]|uniref:Excreted virulence factor EspC (Type VII ESX diderm) n=1 Tax=Luteimicrobium album TaxID=1054550 RepID=A0ABQ6I251_9MICO|nr:hypothetical protein GCM10025864_19870 [Luteimicrobium album]
MSHAAGATPRARPGRGIPSVRTGRDALVGPHRSVPAVTDQPAPFARTVPPPAAVDATASRALDAAAEAAAEARVVAARALDVDWVSRAARAYDGRIDEALGAVDDAVTLLDGAAGAARAAEQRARDGEPPACLAGHPGGR